MNLLQKRIVLTGTAGSGKSSVIDGLQVLGYNIINEPAREVIAFLQENNPEHLPWNNRSKFQDLMEEKCISNWYNNKEGFFDRSLVDEIGYRNFYKHGIPETLLENCKIYQYDKVFMFPFWEEIYKNDDIRKETPQEASAIFPYLVEGYQNTGYDVIIVPKVSISERIKFILSNI